MFIVDKSQNRIQKLEKPTFTSCGVAERAHLQEWIANEPISLGEELLIIQKEFDGFNNTRERLDLLALDKAGNLVIIENKLDDSGHDVVWQALKYASYCSTFTRDTIIEVFQKYLDERKKEHKSIDGEEEQQALLENKFDAIAQLCEFFEVSDIKEKILNETGTQRIILVAAKFRTEVTSTALWLLQKDVDIQCIKVTPYKNNEQLLVVFDKIVPTPEAKELMVTIKTKEAEEKATKSTIKERHILRKRYWTRLLEELKKNPLALYDKISPSDDHWLSAGSGISGCPYSFIFNQKEIRVELNFADRDREVNKFIFDKFIRQKDEIETAFNDKLIWLRLDNKNASRIEFRKEIITTEESNWQTCIAWHVEIMTRLESVMKPRIREITPEVNRYRKDIKEFEDI